MLADMIANINEIKNNLSRYVKKALSGEEVILSHYNIPVAKIVPLEKKMKKNQTVLGRSAKEGKIIADLTGSFIPESDWQMFKDGGESG